MSWQLADGVASLTTATDSASGSIRHTPVAWVLYVLDDLAKHAIFTLKRLDLLRQLGNLQSNIQSVNSLLVMWSGV